jgi:hypothetical protein
MADHNRSQSDHCYTGPVKEAVKETNPVKGAGNRPGSPMVSYHQHPDTQAPSTKYPEDVFEDDHMI